MKSFYSFFLTHYFYLSLNLPQFHNSVLPFFLQLMTQCLHVFFIQKCFVLINQFSSYILIIVFKLRELLVKFFPKVGVLLVLLQNFFHFTLLQTCTHAVNFVFFKHIDFCLEAVFAFEVMDSRSLSIKLPSTFGSAFGG